MLPPEVHFRPLMILIFVLPLSTLHTFDHMFRFSLHLSSYPYLSQSSDTPRRHLYPHFPQRSGKPSRNQARQTAPSLDSLCSISPVLSTLSVFERGSMSRYKLNSDKCLTETTGDLDATYATSSAEAKYWHVAGRYRRRLYSGNSTSAPSNISTASWGGTVILLVTYYTPCLLPLYRDHSDRKRMSRETDADTQEGRISPRTFCKSYRMAFKDSVVRL